MVADIELSIIYPTIAQSITIKEVLQVKVAKALEALLCEADDTCTSVYVALPECSSVVGCNVSAHITMTRYGFSSMPVSRFVLHTQFVSLVMFCLCFVFCHDLLPFSFVFC